MSQPSPGTPPTEADLAALEARVSDLRWTLGTRADEAYFRVLRGLEQLALEEVPRLIAEIRRLRALLPADQRPGEDVTE
jgi:hypothetical protein